MKKIILAVVATIFLGTMLLAQNNNFNPEAAGIYENGMNALRMRRLTLADQQFRELIKKYPDAIHTALARRHLASILRDLRQYDQAIEILKEMISKDKSLDNTRYAQSEILDILYATNRFKQGVEMIEEWRHDNARDIFLNRQLARFYLQSGRKDEAWLLLEAVMEESTAPEAFKDLLDLALRSGEIEKLMQIVESRRARYRTTQYADYMSDCHLALGHKDKAVEVLKNSEDVLQHPPLLRKLSDLQIALEQYDDALSSLNRLLKLTPNEWDIIRKIGHCLFMQDKKQQAIETWRGPLQFPYMQRREFYQEYTTVLIEHQLYDEAMNTFSEARKTLQQPTLFSEEMATVLDALGRGEEALEEYLKVLSEGFYRHEVFEKLYKAYEDGFDLEAGLKRMHKQSSYKNAVLQALLELYFRKADIANLQAVSNIVSASVGNLDEVFYERLDQEALLFPAQFHFMITKVVMQARAGSGLALRLAMLLLEMGPNDHSWRKDAYASAKDTVAESGIADAELKAQLLIKLAEYALYEFNDCKTAQSFLDGILQTELMRAVPEASVKAAIIKARIMTFEESYETALELLKQNETIIQSANQDLFSGDPISDSDFQALIHLERARVQLHKGDYQKALAELKIIVENFTESEWLNEALEMANFITRRSFGNFELLKSALKAERLTMTGQHEAAQNELSSAIAGNASATTLVREMQAEVIELQEESGDPAVLVSKIDKFAQNNPDSHKTADLWELKWRLLKRKAAPAEDIREHLQTFIDSFPSDLRSGKFKKILARRAEQEKNK